MHIFLPIQKKREVDTWLIIDELKRNYPEIIITIPKVEVDGMISIVYENLKQLKPNKWGVLEPQHGETIQPMKLDLILLPLVIFDRNGYRIGYGKGYYDRYLKLCKSSVSKIGLSLLPALDDLLYYEEHDEKMNLCITADRVHSFETSTGGV